MPARRSALPVMTLSADKTHFLGGGGKDSLRSCLLRDISKPSTNLSLNISLWLIRVERLRRRFPAGKFATSDFPIRLLIIFAIYLFFHDARKRDISHGPSDRGENPVCFHGNFSITFPFGVISFSLFPRERVRLSWFTEKLKWSEWKVGCILPWWKKTFQR